MEDLEYTIIFKSFLRILETLFYKSIFKEFKTKKEKKIRTTA